MNNFTERTWMGVVMGEELKKLMATYVQVPAARACRAEGYTGPITLSNYERVPACPGGSSKRKTVRDRHAYRGLDSGCQQPQGCPSVKPLPHARGPQRRRIAQWMTRFV